MILLMTSVLVGVLMGSASAQSTAYTVAVFNGSVTNPATATPVTTPVTYLSAQVPCGVTPKGVETLPIVNPVEGRIDDPADATKDCTLALQPQIQALPAGVVYRAAIRAVTATGPSEWSALTSPFTTAAPQVHPCDGTPPTTGTTLAGARTLNWCWNGLDVNGTPTTITVWTATIDGTRVSLPTVTVGVTPNAQGKRLYSAPITLAAGTRSVRVAGTNAVGEAAFSTAFTVTVTVPPGVPSAAEVRSIQ